MSNFKETKGNMINLSYKGLFDVVLHGCNCFNTMGSGLAPQMAKAYGADKFEKESEEFYGDVNKLGTIDVEAKYLEHIGNGKFKWNPHPELEPREVLHQLFVVNCYSQYGFGRNHMNGTEKPLDYEALILCLRKINFRFSGSRIGVPHIGADLAGGDINKIREIVKTELKDCFVTFIEFNGEPTEYIFKPKMLFLDDKRIPTDVYSYKENASFLYDLKWDIVRNYDEFSNYLTLNNIPDIVSFDHDLHEEHYTPSEYWDDYNESEAYQLKAKQNYEVPTGETCALLLKNAFNKNGVEPLKLLFHSQNPVGVNWMKKVFENN